MQHHKPQRTRDGGEGRARARRPSGRPIPKPRVERGSPLRVEILSIGRELLRGRIRDANGPALARRLTDGGALVHRITVIDDSVKAIAASVTDALGRGTHIVLTTGGLGPGADDCTLEAIAEALSRPMTFHPAAKRLVEDAYRRLRAERQVSLQGLNAAREKMCSIPIGSELIENPVGASPGVLLRLAGGSAVLALPGVPEEALRVLEGALEQLHDLFDHGFVAHREVETPTRDESALRPVLDRVAEEHPGVRIHSESPGFGAGDACITVVIEAAGPSRHEAELAVDGAVRRLLALAGSGP